MATVQQTDEPQFASLGALFAFEHRSHGAEHLDRVLNALVEAGSTRRESMLRAATELKVLNHSAADTVRKAAAECPSATNLGFCNYDDALDSANVRAWLRGQERLVKKKRQQCEQLLREAGIDTAWINGEAGQ
jgi:hypothetical protein